VDAQTGLLVDRDDERAFADALVRVVGDGELRSRLTAGALAHAARFTWEATATGLMRALATEAQRRSTP
jgi:glycosyltransferase involved in cell wall biosynthesis